MNPNNLIDINIDVSLSILLICCISNYAKNLNSNIVFFFYNTLGLKALLKKMKPYDNTSDF